MGVESVDGRPPAVLLFLERVAESGAAVDPADDDVIAEICRRLDGLPLAIELAAARTGVLSPAQIFERLDDRFTLLTGGRRRTRGRQQTLETTIAWSYDLLDADEQDALRRISVMPAAFDLNLAAAVLARSTTATLDLLDSLTSRSLLQTTRDDRSPQLRYRLLETIRAYAHDRLVEQGESEATRHRHARHLVERLAATSIPLSMNPEHRLLADDALAAIDWAHANGDTSLGAGLVCAASTILIARGMFEKGLAVHEWAATVDDPVMSSKVYAVGAILAMAASSRRLERYATLSLRAAGDLPVPWRALLHALFCNQSILVDTEVFTEHLRLGRVAGLQPEADPIVQRSFDLHEAVSLIWHGDGSAAIPILERARWFPDFDPLIAMNQQARTCSRACWPVTAPASLLTSEIRRFALRGWTQSDGVSTGWSATRPSARPASASSATMNRPDATLSRSSAR